MLSVPIFVVAIPVHFIEKNRNCRRNRNSTTNRLAGVDRPLLNTGNRSSLFVRSVQSFHSWNG